MNDIIEPQKSFPKYMWIECAQALGAECKRLRQIAIEEKAKATVYLFQLAAIHDKEMSIEAIRFWPGDAPELSYSKLNKRSVEIYREQAERELEITK